MNIRSKLTVLKFVRQDNGKITLDNVPKIMYNID